MFLRYRWRFCSEDNRSCLSFPPVLLAVHAKWHEKQKSGSSEGKWGQRGTRARSKWRRHSKLSEWPSQLRNFHVRAVLQSWFKQKTVKWSITRNELISCFVLITAQVSSTFHILIHFKPRFSSKNNFALLTQISPSWTIFFKTKSYTF